MGGNTYWAIVVLAPRRRSPDIIGQQIHLEVQLPVSSQQRIGMRQQQFAGPGQHNTATGTVEQRRLILHLQFMNMLAYSRLTDIQFLRSLCKTQVSRYAIKYLQTNPYAYNLLNKLIRYKDMGLFTYFCITNT